LAEADEQKLDTVRLQEAIDSCAPGKAIELRGEAGKNAFLSGPLELRHAVTLLIDSGVTLLASRDPRLFDVYPGVCGTVTAQQRRGCKPLIHVADTAAAVMGDGIIDGRGGSKLLNAATSWWDLAQEAKVKNAYQNCPRIIVAERADNFILYRITLKNSPNFHVIVSRTNGFTAWGVRIDSPKTSRNTDGIDPSSSTNVSILYCFICAGDDNVAIKAGAAGPASHITVAHNHFYSGHGMSIGSETNGGVDALKVRLDGVVVSGFTPRNLRAAHARVVVGPAPSNLVVAGEDVAVDGTGTGSSPDSCRDAFVPFPTSTQPVQADAAARSSLVVAS